MPHEWMERWAMLMLDPFATFWSQVVAKLPSLVGALLLLLVGSFLGRVAREVTGKLLTSTRVDEFLGKVGFGEVMARIGLGRSASYAIGFLIYWLILLVFVVSAANALSLTVVSELLNRFVLFMPRLIASALVLFGGLLLGHFVGEVIRGACEANRLRSGALIARVFNGIVVVFASIIGLEELGIDTAILTSSIQIILGTLGLAVALAFGLGGRDVAAEIIRDFLKVQKNR